jgi:mannosyl-oligosaccharide alpha-1,2-mannosidase
MPETFDLVRCRTGTCGWNESAWHTSILKNHEDNLKDHPATADSVIKDKRLPLGFTGINDSRYILRPEAIESIFVLYRTTGDVSLLEKAWDMWGAIRTLTETDLAFSAVDSVEHDEPRKTDSMESFWMSETLKYFYLIFSEPDLVSLDEFVFNTEAHPFRRLVV